MMRALLFLITTLTLASLCRAQNNCTFTEMGTLSGIMGLHIETLLPGQRSLRFNIPPVCAKQNGVRVVACEETGAPELRLRGREVVLTRRGTTTGFAMLSIALYCAPTVPPTVTPALPPAVVTATPPAVHPQGD